MTITNPTRELSKASYKNMEFSGKVIRNDDPKKLQRVKIRVSKLHDGIPDDDIPWTYPSSTNSMGGSSSGGNAVGGSNVPPVGSQVFLTLQDNSLYFGKYSLGPTTKNVKSKEFDSDYPHNRGSVDPSGNKTENNNKTDNQKHIHVSGTEFHIDGKGRMKIKIADKQVGKDAKSTNPKGITIEVQGPVVVHASEDIIFKSAKNIQFIAEESIIASWKKEWVNKNTTSVVKPPPQTVSPPTAPTPRKRPELESK